LNSSKTFAVINPESSHAADKQRLLPNSLPTQCCFCRRPASQWTSLFEVKRGVPIKCKSCFDASPLTPFKATFVVMVDDGLTAQRDVPNDRDDGNNAAKNFRVEMKREWLKQNAFEERLKERFERLQKSNWFNLCE
jgi:hypothetical protein